MARFALPRLPLRRMLRSMPAWARITLAIGAIALGAVIISRPTTALDVLALLIGGGMVLIGVVEFAERGEASTPARGRWRLALALGWIALGVFVLAWPGLTVRAVATITGVLLVLNGIAGLGSALRSGIGWDERIADAALGVTGVIFGILALAWPDITLLVVAVVFGATLIMRGAMDLWVELRRKRPARPAGARPRRRRWGRTAVALLSLTAAVAVTLVTAPLREGSTVVDEFYAAPRTIPSEPGQLVRYEPFTREVPSKAQAWRILYTTTDDDGAVRVASGLVVVPTGGEPGTRWPVIDWNHGTTGYAQHCAPSLQVRPFAAGALYVIGKVIREGWAVVATDYIGLGTAGSHPYLFGEPSARASLDAVRAAQQIEEASLSSSTVVWGHSQGGGAALWTGALARSYAPEVWVRGVAAFAPASDPPALVDHVTEVPGGLIFASYAFAAFSSAYPDITYQRYIRPGAQELLRAMSERCLTDPDIALSIVGVVGTAMDPNLFTTDPSYGELGTRLRENIAPTWIGAPLFLGQGSSDSIVSVAAQDRYVERVCARGQRVDYRRYAGYEHAQVMETYSPMIDDVVAWTHDRFAGVSIASQCETTDVTP